MTKRPRRRKSASSQRGESPEPHTPSPPLLDLPDNFLDALRAFAAHGVEFLLVGGYAVGVHGYIRATGDMDLWIRPTPENARRAWAALADFGAPLGDLTEADLARPETVFQMGVIPERVDVLCSVSGVSFDEAWPHRFTVHLPGLDLSVIGREELLRNKKAAARPKDLIDVDWLERHPPRSP